MFSSRSLMVSGLTFKSLIHFELIFAYSVRQGSSFILLHVAVQFSQHHLLKRLSFLHCMLFAPLSQINYTYTRGFISGLSILFHSISANPMLFYYYGFVIQLEIREHNTSSFFLFSQDVSGYLGSFVVLNIFQNFLFYFCEKHPWDFDRDCIESVYSFR